METQLWAKKPFGGSAPTVVEHCEEVREAAGIVWKHTAVDLIAALGTGVSLDSFGASLSTAAILHDFGKVNSAFQQMLLSTSVRQPVRHEIVAAWLLSDPALEVLAIVVDEEKLD